MVAVIHFNGLRIVWGRAYSCNSVFSSGKEQLFDFSRAVYMTLVIRMVWCFQY